MAGGDDANNGGRVTTRELYDALQQQNRERAEMERRILGKLDDVCDVVSRHDERIKKNDIEITNLRNRSNILDIALGVATALAATISTVIGHDWSR